MKSLAELKAIKETVYLCTSLSKKEYNKDCILCEESYKYQYKIYLKENAYGILLNAFGISVHPKEQECLIKLSDIETYNKIN